MLTDSAAPGEIAFRKAFIHHRRPAFCHVGFTEPSSFAQRYAHRFQVRRSCPAVEHTGHRHSGRQLILAQIDGSEWHANLVGWDEQERRRRCQARLHPRNFPQRGFQPRRKALFLVRRNGNARADHLLRIEPRIDRQDVGETPDQQSGARQEHERERNLGNHESAAHRLAAAPGRRAATWQVHRARWSSTQQMRDRQRSDQQGQNCGDDGRVSEHLAIQPKRQGVGQKLRGEVVGGAEAAPREEEPASRAEAREQRTFDEQLPRECASSCAERQSHGKLPAPCIGTGEEEIGDIDAADQQHEKHAPLQQPEGGLDRLSPLRLHRVNPDAVAGAFIELAILRRGAVVILLIQCFDL